MAVATHAIARARPRTSVSGLVLQAACGVLVAVAAAVLTVELTHLTALKSVAVMLVAAGSLWCATTRRTGLALAVWMLYIGLLDGYLKLATGTTYVTFVRDALLYSIVIGLLVKAAVQRKRLTLPPLSWWVVAYTIVVLVQLLNPRAGSLVHSLAGVRQDLEWVPLFFLTFLYVRTTRALRIFVLLLAVIAAANGIAGYIQFHETPAQFATWGPGYAARILGTGNFAFSGRTFAGTNQGQTRPFGLGSDSGAGGVFGAFAFAGLLALAALSSRRRYLLLAVALAVGATAAIITSQARSVIVISVIIVIAFALLTTTSRTRVSALFGFALAGLVAVVVGQAVISSAGSNTFRYNGLSPTSLVATTNKARGKSIAEIPHNLVTYPFGAGLATVGPASGDAPGPSAITQAGQVDSETEFSFLIVESGIAGALALTGFTIALLVLGLRRTRQEPDRDARILLAAIVAPILGLLALFVISAPTPTTPGGPYLFAAGGIISYWLVALPAARRREAAAAAAQPDPIRPEADGSASEAALPASPVGA